MKTLELKNISSKIGNQEILKNINLKVNNDEIVILMGPNGAGKSTISNVIMGNPKHEITKGKILLDKKDITELDTTERAKKGIFLSFQNPVEISGVTMTNFLRTSYNSIKETNINLSEFMKLLKSAMEELDLDSKFRGRFVNSGFSGGEKKRSELLQLILFEPDFVILDEIDSGLDIDGLKLVGEMLNKILKKRKMGVIMITHSNKILKHIKPDKVVVLKNGSVVKQGGEELIHEIEEKGFK